MIEFLVRHFVRDYQQVQDPAVRERYGVLSGGVGICLNLLLSLGKFFAGLLSGSIAVTADAFNNLSDVGSSVITVIGMRLAGQPADKEHPFGHGRIEYLTALCTSIMVISVGVLLLWSSVQKIIHPEELNFSYISLLVLLVSILGKAFLSAFNRLFRRIVPGRSEWRGHPMDSHRFR